jgi:hypothetical protein
MTWYSIFAWTIIAVVVVVSFLAQRRRLAPMLSRPCAGRDWRRAFPDAPKADVRAFLKLFVDSFALRPHHYLAFRPNDQIIDVYRALNPPSSVAGDAMELETFAQELERQYRVRLESIWRDDLTLGEIFSRTRSA